jgi:phage I-like protein
MSSDIDDLKGRMDNLEAPGEKVDELETEVNTLSEKIEKQLVEANERIAALEARLVEAEKVVVPLKAFFTMLSAFAPKG